MDTSKGIALDGAADLLPGGARCCRRGSRNPVVPVTTVQVLDSGGRSAAHARPCEHRSQLQSGAVRAEHWCPVRGTSLRQVLPVPVGTVRVAHRRQDQCRVGPVQPADRVRQFDRDRLAHPSWPRPAAPAPRCYCQPTRLPPTRPRPPATAPRRSQARPGLVRRPRRPTRSGQRRRAAPASRLPLTTICCPVSAGSAARVRPGPGGRRVAAWVGGRRCGTARAAPGRRSGR